MIDLYLKAESEAVMNAELTEAGFTKDEGPGHIYMQGVCLDVIGVIYKPTGKMLEYDGEMQYEEQAPIEGWHVNLRVIDDNNPIIAKLAHLRTQAKTPVRVWA